MKPSEKCKVAGLKSLAELVKATGVNEQTLIRWSRNKPRLFQLVIDGTIFQKSQT
jgi:hypothetical protein